MLTVQFVSDGNKIHSGPCFPFINILRPGFDMRPLFTGNPPLYSDPADAAAWVTATDYTVGQLILPVASPNGLVYRVKSITGTPVAGAAEPTWPSVIGATVTDGATPSIATIECVGPYWKWTAGAPAFADQQIRTSDGNIRVALNSGTMSAGEPTWGAPYGAVDSDNGVLWLNMGLTKASGSVDASGNMVFDMSATMIEQDVDQYTSPLTKDINKETAKITGTLAELNFEVVRLSIPNAVYNSGTDPAFPAGVQDFEEIGFGGNLNVITPCVCLVSPRKNVAGGFVRAWMNKAVPAGSGSWPFARAKYSTYKVEWDGLAVPAYPAGWQIGRMVRN